jgi:MFS family permease
MILIGIGGGLAFNPVLMAAMSDVEPQDAGLASGVANTAFMMGGALGLAALASLAASRTHHLEAAGRNSIDALTGGYHAAFALGAVLAVTAAIVGGTLLRNATAAAGAHEPQASLEAA